MKKQHKNLQNNFSKTKRNKIKILIYEPVSDLGGVSMYLLQLIKHLSRDRFNIYFVASGNGEITKRLQNLEVTTYSTDLNYKYSDFLKSIFLLRSIIKKEKFDVVFLNTLKSGFLGSISSLGLNVKIIYLGHSWRFFQKKNILTKFIFYLFDLFVCKISDFVVVLSEKEYKMGILYKLIKREKSAIVPFSLDADSFSKPNLEDTHYRHIINFPENSFIIGMIGRLVEQKDPETFIRAASVISKKISEARFLWIGNGELKEKIEKLARKLFITDKFFILDYVKNEDMSKIFSIIDIVLFTSKFEGRPLAIIEAMLAKKYIVASNVIGISDFIEDKKTGFLFPKGNYEEAAFLVKNIYDNKNTFSYIIDNAYKKVVNQHTPAKKLAENFDNIFKKVIEFE